MPFRTHGSTFGRGRPILVVLGVLSVLPTLADPVGAQPRDYGPIILELPGSTRALALGDAFALGFGDPDALFYQPGVLDRIQGLAGSIQRYGPSATLTTFSAGTSWLSGGIGLGIQHLSYGADGTDPIDGADLLALPRDPGSLRTNGDRGVSELVVSLGYGRRVKGIRMGVVGKLIEERFGSWHPTTVAFDLGVAASPGPLTVGLAVQNLGSDMCIGGDDIPLPSRISLGASTDRAMVGPLDVSAVGRVLYRDDGDVIAAAGLEVAYWPVTGRTFVGRIGFRHLPDGFTGSPVTFGGGFVGDDLVLEYAYEGFESGGPSHRFSLGWR
jgi:hypothetical protein